jgi:hypothetical protein
MAMVGETNRAPFDLPEAEGELVGGFHTEYSSLKFALFFLAEYINMVTVSALATTLFLGGWRAPWPISLWESANTGWFPMIWFFGKISVFIFVFIWLRGTLPRLRYDQFMKFGWKVLLPVSIGWILIVATARASRNIAGFDTATTARWLLIPLTILLFITWIFEEVKNRRSKRDAELVEEEIEEFMGDAETFDLERAKRRFINSLIQGAAFKGGHMFNLVSRELNDIDPRLMNLYTVSQSLMEHAYWLFPDMEGMAGGGGGQMGQSEVDTETDPPTVKARAMTFPLLIHELVKGIYEIFGTHGLPDDPKQQEMIMSAEDTLPAEIWDSRLGPIFWEKFLQAHPAELFEEEQKYLQHYLFMRFSKLEPEEFFELSKQILMGRSEANQILQRMVDEIVEILKKYEYESKMSDDDDDDDSNDGYNDDDFDDLDDIDLSSLGF